MTEMPKPGSVVWTDLTVPDAGRVRDFYMRVVGWTSDEISMGEYSDYVMISSTGDGVAGVCHARGQNVNVPPQWLMYVTVKDLDKSVAECTLLGGEVVDGPRAMSGGRFCVIKDPAGAVCALYSPPAPTRE